MKNDIYNKYKDSFKCYEYESEDDTKEINFNTS